MNLQRIVGVCLIAMAAACASKPVGSADSNKDASVAAGVNPDLANEELADSSIAVPAVTMTDLRYRAGEGGGVVVVETSSPAAFRTREVPRRNQVIIEIANCKLPARFKQPYNTKEFKQDIVSLNAYEDKDSTTARVVIQFRAPASAAVRQEGRQLFITYAPPGHGSNLVDREAEIPGSYSVEGAQVGSALGNGTVDDLNATNARFYGKPVNLETRETPVREVIAALAEQSGANIVLSDNVKGNITLKLRQVPWDQALLLIMRTLKLGYVRQGSVLRITSIAELQAESKEARDLLEAQRQAQPLRTKVVPISFAKVQDIKVALDPFKQALKAQVTADARTNTVVITDIPEAIDRMVSVARALDSPPLQVLIEGKIIEASESFNRTFGINWALSGAASQVGNTNVSTSGPSFQNNTAVQANTLGLTLGTFDVLGDLNAQLGIQEEAGTIKVLSAPRVVTLNNVAATIQQITQVPLPQQVAQTGGTGAVAPVIGVTYKNIQLQLTVTPQITAESDVILAVDLTREFVASGAPSSTTPIETRTAKTTVSVRSGSTAVIGGIYQNDISHDETGVPYLKDIPILGYLFKATSDVKKKNELLLFLTPRILNADKVLSKEETL